MTGGVQHQVTRNRWLAAFLIAAGLPLLTTLLVQAREQLTFPSAALVFLLAAIVIGAVGGAPAAIVGTVASLGLLGWFFAYPYGQLAVGSQQDLITLAVFVVVAVIVSVIVERSNARALEAERARADVAAAEALVRTNELRGALLSAVSHDLRTPLASIKAASSTLLGQPHSDAERHLLQTVDRSADRLDAMVANLLDSSRIRTGVLVVRLIESSVEELVTTLLEGEAYGPERVQLAIDDGLPVVRVDPVLMERVLVNLVNNALFFSTGTLTIEGSRVGSVLELRIVDHGPGIPEADRVRVLEPFQRLTDTSDGRGVGLGLSVANGFVKAMDGTLELRETRGGGTTVAIALPVVD